MRRRHEGTQAPATHHGVQALGKLRHRGPVVQSRRRGLVLFVVLVIVALLALLAAGYAYLVRAELKNVESSTNEHQATLAAESAAPRFVIEARNSLGDPDRLANNPGAFREAVVYSADDQENPGGTGGSTLRQAHLSNALTGSSNSQKKNSSDSKGTALAPAWRFSAYAPDLDHPGTVRYGATSECGKLDINRASADQLRRLFTEVLKENNSGGSAFEGEIDVDELVDSLLDWRERGTEPRPKGAKDDWYMTNRRPGYRCKGAPFETVDELLLVRGFTATVLYGEDANRNGLLDANEDDGDRSFPPDNADGVLDRGLAPYLTVWSRDYDTSALMKPKININMQDVDELEKQLGAMTDLNADVATFIVEQRRAGRRFADPLDLIPIPPDEEEQEEQASSQPSDDKSGERDGNNEDEGKKSGDEQQDGGKKPADLEGGQKPGSDFGQNESGNKPGANPGDTFGGKPEKPPTDNSGGKPQQGPGVKPGQNPGFSPGKPPPDNGNNPKKDPNGGGKNRQKQPDDQNGSGQGGRRGPTVNPRGGSLQAGGQSGVTPKDTSNPQPSGGSNGTNGPRGPRGPRAPGSGGNGQGANPFGGGSRSGSGNRPPQNRPPVGQQQNGQSGNQSGSEIGRPGRPSSNRSGQQGDQSGASGGQTGRGQQQQQQGPPPPGTIDDLPMILDRLTTRPVPIGVGRIDINAAPKPVLMTLTDLNEDTVDHLIEARSGLEGPVKMSPAWLVQQGVVSLSKLRKLLPKITTRSGTYAIESVGFADHVDTVKRIYMILEMRGPIGQVLYYRDLTGLGPAYHPHDEETRGPTNQSFR